MKPFNREKFLLYMLAGLLAWQAAIFSFGVVLCSRVTPQTNVTLVCPEIGSRFDKFVQTTLGAVLGLLAGAAALSTNQRQASSASDDRDESSVSQPPLQLQQPSPKDFSPAERQVQGQEKKPERGGRKA
jgi:hypothetical protein